MINLLDEVVSVDKINEKFTKELNILRQNYGFSLRRRIIFVIGVNWYSKQWGVCFCIILFPTLISCYIHEDGQ